MTEFITLTCPSCSGKLEITEDIERFACAHCGTEHLIKRGGGIVSLAPVIENVSRGVNSTASELALTRLKEELSDTKIKLHNAKDQEQQYNEREQYKIPSIIGVVLFLVGGVMLLIFTELTLLAMIILMTGIVMVGAVYYLHSKEFMMSKKEAEEKVKVLNDKYQKLRADYKFHHDRANKL